MRKIGFIPLSQSEMSKLYWLGDLAFNDYTFENLKNTFVVKIFDIS